MKFKNLLKDSQQNLAKRFNNIKGFLKFLATRAKNDTIFRVSASLSYTSVIAIVPIFAIGIAIFSAFPVFSGVKEQIQELLLKNFVPEIEQEVSQYFQEFINATAQLTTIGVVGLAITAILMLSTIENSLNFIFKVHKPRRIATKITLYWTVVTLGPLLLGAAMSLRGYLYATDLMPDAISPSVISNLLPAFITFIVLMMIYILVPNRKVKVANASIGALTALFLFWLLRKLFGIIILKSATYKTLYGALAVLPIFLVWMYLAWSVVIFGAVVTAALGEYRHQDKDNDD